MESFLWVLPLWSVAQIKKCLLASNRPLSWHNVGPRGLHIWKTDRDSPCKKHTWCSGTIYKGIRLQLTNHHLHGDVLLCCMTLASAGVRRGGNFSPPGHIKYNTVLGCIPLSKSPVHSSLCLPHHHFTLSSPSPLHFVFPITTSLCLPHYHISLSYPSSLHFVFPREKCKGLQLHSWQAWDSSVTCLA